MVRLRRYARNGEANFCCYRARLQLTKEQTSPIFNEYLEDRKEHDEYKPGKQWKKNKSCGAAKMKKEVGSEFLANALWQIGCPWLPSLAVTP